MEGTKAGIRQSSHEVSSSSSKVASMVYLLDGLGSSGSVFRMVLLDSFIICDRYSYSRSTTSYSAYSADPSSSDTYSCKLICSFGFSAFASLSWLTGRGF